METNGEMTAENIRACYEKRGFAVGTTVLEAGKVFPSHKHSDESYVFNMGGSYSIQFDDETVRG